MHDDVATSFPDPDAARRRRTTRTLVAGGVVAGFFLAGLGVAFARTSSSHTTRLLAAPAAIKPTQAVTPATPGQTAPNSGAPNGGPGGRFGHGGPFGGKLFGFGGFGGHGGFGHFGGLHGEFTIKKANKEFNIKKGEYYTCGKGKTDQATNISKEVGIHRISILIPA